MPYQKPISTHGLEQEEQERSGESGRRTGWVKNQRREDGQTAHNEDSRASAIFGGEVDGSVKTRRRACWLGRGFRLIFFALAFGIFGASGRVGHVIGRHTEKLAARLHEHPILNSVGPFNIRSVVTLTSVIVTLLVTTFLLLFISVAFR